MDEGAGSPPGAHEARDVGARDVARTETTVTSGTDVTCSKETWERVRAHPHSLASDGADDQVDVLRMRTKSAAHARPQRRARVRVHTEVGLEDEEAARR